MAKKVLQWFVNVMIYKYRWLSQALDDMSQEIGYVYSLFGHKAAQRAEARIHDRIIIAIVKLRTASTHCFCRRRCLSAKHRSGTSDMSAVTVLGACDASSSVSLTKTRVWSARPKRTLLRASPSPRRESEEGLFSNGHGRQITKSGIENGRSRH